jgi:hypothetical protein
MFGVDDAIGATIQCFKDGDWNKFGERFGSNFVNSWKLFGGMFNTFHDVHNFGDFMKGVAQFVGRFTWGALGTAVGFLWGYGQIESNGGKINRYKNQSMITFDDGREMAYTIGFVTVGPSDIMTNIKWRAHEYGHYIISLITGPLYLIHGLQSLSVPDSALNYYDYPSEKLADYFGGVKRDQYGTRYVP